MKNSYIKLKLLASLIVCLAIVNSINAQTIVYVASDGTGDGSTWATATTGLQEAISASSSGTEIWIKAGTYYAPGDTNFYLNEQVSLYGGFAGTETDKTERTDYGMGGANETILSGDTDENGINDSLNAINVIRGFEISAATFIDGLTISDGYADDDNGDGGGMYLQASSPTILNCTFTNNYCDDNGAAIYLRTSSEPAILGCYFISNHANEDAGGIYTQNDGITPYIGNCVFANNTAGDQGGAIWINHCSTVVANCTFVKNKVLNQDGAAMRIYLSSSAAAETPTTAILLNNAFWGNEAPTTSDIEVSELGLATITNCALSGTITEVVGVVSTNLVDISIADPMFTNAAGTAGHEGYNASSDWSLQAGSPLIDAGVIGGPETDILNKLRDANPDIGAYEYFLVNVNNIRVNNYARIFPNPASDNIYVLPLNEKLSEVIIIDITGREIERLDNILNKNLMTVDLSNKVSGIYFIKLLDVYGNGYTEKFILK